MVETNRSYVLDSKNIYIWNEKVVQIKRVTKVCKGGKKLSFSAIVIIGNQNGKVGVGHGKAEDVSTSIAKGIMDAKKNIINVPLTKTKTIKKQ